MSDFQANAEMTGELFARDLFLRAQLVTKRIVTETAARVRPKMNYQDIEKLLFQRFMENDVQKFWHPTKVRIGRDTLKTFKEPSDPSIRVQNQDLFFIDVGPVYHNMEADYGETFSIGDDPSFDKISKASKYIFNEVEKRWDAGNVCGKALYQEAATITHNYGYKFNLSMDGHRLGDFPHALFWKKSLAEYEKVPSAILWVLEIMIRHPIHDYGAFYERVLGLPIEIRKDF